MQDPRLAPSLGFKKQVGKVISSIVLFFIVYILLILAAIGLAIGCFYAGGALIIALPKFLTIVVGLGMMALGISVIIFLIKFIFAVSKNENPSRVEIKEEEQPRLFAFIRALSKETGTPFPKKIFISPDVNACVFYHSSFWSMFLPVRKNLEIGLGLVNSINQSEFKAVIAHEFGHFSQRSMKLGSFTYNVNQIIYNMLYENTGYTNFLNTWGRGHQVLAFFAGLTANIASGIQRVLRIMYGFINKNYLGLSREMEFHADAVAASVAGGNNLVSALSRIDIASDCYNRALQNANEWLKENKATKNIFGNQLSVLKSWAIDHQLPLKHGLPEVSFQFIQSISKSRVNFKNQWASHPTLEERTEQMEKLSMNSIPNDSSTWLLFNDAEHLQEKLTANLYHAIQWETPAEWMGAEQFDAWVGENQAKHELPSAYLGFYSDRYINASDWDLSLLQEKIPPVNFDSLFNPENAGLHRSIQENMKDIALVEAIKGKRIDVKTFDFDGKKYELTNCDEILEILKKDIEGQQARIDGLDKEAFSFFHHQSKDCSSEILRLYHEYQTASQGFEAFALIANKVLQTINPFSGTGLMLEEIKPAIADLKNNSEKNLKEIYRQCLEKKIIDPDIDNGLYMEIQNFLNRDYAYFIPNEFVTDELNELSGLIFKVSTTYNEYKFMKYRNMLEEQLRLYTLTQ